MQISLALSFVVLLALANTVATLPMAQSEKTVLHTDGLQFEHIDSKQPGHLIFTEYDRKRRFESTRIIYFVIPEYPSKSLPFCSSKMSGPAFVCQESFQANNATSCLRYTTLKKCIKHGQESQLNYLCVGANTISIGGSTVPAPANLTMTPFLCTLDACPTEAPHSKKKHNGGKKTTVGPTFTGVTTLPVILVLALVVSQMVLF